MGTVVLLHVVSVDDSIADDDVGPLHEFSFDGDTPIRDADEGFDRSGAGRGFMVPSASIGYVRSWWDSIGVIVMGRRLFDLVDDGRGSRPPGTTWSSSPTARSPKAGTRRPSTTS